MDIFFFNDTATTEIYTLSLHDALPISDRRVPARPAEARVDAHRDHEGAAPGPPGRSAQGSGQGAGPADLDGQDEQRADRARHRAHGARHHGRRGHRGRAPRDPPHAEPRDREHLRGHPRHPHADHRPGHHRPRRVRPMSPGPTILVVDDDRDVRETIVELLRGEGFDVVEAANGLEALLQVKRSRPAGVVLDLLMPRLGGLDALKRIRTFDPAIRIVVITGSPDPELVRQAKALGAVAVLTKPISPSDLLGPLRAAAAPAPAASALPTRTPSARSAAAGATATAEILVVAGGPGPRGRPQGGLPPAGSRGPFTGDAPTAAPAVVWRAPPTRRP